MEFYKMHGCGNDFILFACPKGAAGWLTKQMVRNLCRRHYGVGADGVILIQAPHSAHCDFKMRIFNADGSEAEMCGNGIRCLGKLVFELGLTRKKELLIQTAKSNVPIKLIGSKTRIKQVKVRLPEPSVIHPLPAQSFRKFLAVGAGPALPVQGIYRVSLGNPHCVIFTSEPVDALALSTYGPLIERHRLFPHRTNVEFVNILSRSRVQSRVWERGVGETLACGSGACATAAAGIYSGQLNPKQVVVGQPGGNLIISWMQGQGLFMTGPAEFVFSGNYRQRD